MRVLASVGGLLSLVVAVSSVSAAPSVSPPIETPAASGPDVGTWLPGAAAALPEPSLPPASVDRVRRHLEAGDTARALRDAQRLADEKKWGRERDAAQMVVGVLEQELGSHDLASEAFTKVRTADGPLASLAAYLEAEEDLARGRPWATIKECETLVQRWPQDEHVSDCLRLTAVAQAEVGHWGAARASAAAYDEEHPKGPIGEQIELHLALRQERTNPDQAAPALVRLAVSHQAALTGRAAEEALGRLRAAGVQGAELPTDPGSRMARAISLRDSGRRDEAWAAFQELRDLGATDPSVARWVAENEERFGWRCWRWNELADRYSRLYAEAPSADLAWDLYKVLVRGSRFDEASTLALDMQKKWGGSSAWRRSHEDVGRAMLLAGRYDDAVRQLDVVAQRGGWSGRRAKFLAGFATLLAGRAEEAVGRLDAVVASGGDTEIEARYWRARALASLERTDAAAADRSWILTTDPWSWYAILIRQDDPDLPKVTPYARDGTWPGPRDVAPAVAGWPEPVLLGPAPERLRPVEVTPAVARSAARPGSPGFAAWSWGDEPAPALAALGATPTLSFAAPELSPTDDPAELPASYRASPLYDPDDARARLMRLAADNGQDFPDLLRIADLASVGLYDLAGTGMSGFYEHLRKVARAGDGRARRLLATPTDGWKSAFLASRDHHHTARQMYGAWEQLPDPVLATEALRLGYPLAHDRYVWTHGREHDVDPLMVLGLMRQESTYNPVAVSSAGARGAMQIMPRTGHLLADLVHDTRFNAGDLEDPVFAVGYGIRYLGLLLERYEGAYPLAVASYNGGPHNVSSWLAGTGLDVPTDVFVELIPFRETRDYVKKVSAGYAAYVSLYAPTGSAVVVPPHPTGNHPEVVDF